MRKHVTAVAVLHIGFGLLGLMAAALVLAITFGPDLMAYFYDVQSRVLDIFAIIGFAVAGLLAIPSLMGIIGGQGLLNYRPWARRLILLLSVFEIFNIPIGTILGLYSMWTLVQDETEELFAAGAIP
jgi:hypothetical protein